MSVKEKGDTIGAIVCPNCKHWIYLIAEDFYDKAKKKKVVRVLG